MSKERFLNIGLCTFLFFLPWQTRWIFSYQRIEGQLFEYGNVSVYVTELLLLLVLLFVGKPRLKSAYRRVVYYGSLVGLALLPGLFFRQNLLISINALILLVTAFALFVLMLDERVDLVRVSKWFVYGLIVPSVFGLWQVASGTSWASKWLGLASHDAQRLGESVMMVGSERTLRAVAGFSHPNVLGGYLAIGIIACVWISFHAKTYRARMGWMGIGVLFAATVLATSSQSAWLGLFIASVALYFVKTAPTLKIGKFAAILSVGVLLIGSYVYLFESAANIITSTQIKHNSDVERVEMIREMPSVMTPATWVFGNGIGTYTLALAKTHPGREWWEYQPVHAVPLLVIGEVGILGFLFLVQFLARIDMINFRRFPNREALVAFSMGNVLLPPMLFDHYLWSGFQGLALAAFVLALTTRLAEYETQPLV